LEMGKRDYRHRERKKPKKDARKPSGSDLLPAPAGVEVIKKGKKEKATDEG
jgi:hypothetical protein